MLREWGVPTSVARYESPEAKVWRWLTGHLRRRAPAVWASAVFIIAALIYSFWWGLHADWGSPLHLNWNTPSDLWLTPQTARQVAHGQMSSLYAQYHFQTFPGVAFLLAPAGALISAANLTADLPPAQQWVHPQAWFVLEPCLLLLSAVSLFAFDALAERLGADGPRRYALAFTEAVALWNVSVFWGHPEDVLAVALVAYALCFAFNSRWNGVAWLFGLAVAFQPLVLAGVPVLLAMAGVKRWARFLARAAVPGVVVLLPPLIANFHATATALTQQPNYPTASANHETPWTALAPRLHLVPGVWVVSAGPGRLVSLILACGVGWWSLRWRDRPEMLVWAVALTFSLRCLTESVMDPYYLWPVLAVAMVASVRSQPWRFAGTLVTAIVVTVICQSHFGWGAWWTLNMLGLVVILVCAVPLHLVEVAESTAVRDRARAWKGRPQSSQPAGGTKRRRHATG